MKPIQSHSGTLANIKFFILSGFGLYFRSIVSVTTLLFLCLLSYRVFEFVILFLFGIIGTEHFWVFSKCFLYDLNACSVLALLLLPFVWFPFKKWPNITLKFLKAIMVILLFTTVALSYYFLVNKELLGVNVFYYSIKEIQHLISAEITAFNTLFWLPSFLLLAIFIFIISKLKTTRFRYDWIITLVFAVLGIINISQIQYSCPVSWEYDSVLEYNLAFNKNDYLLRTTIIKNFFESNATISAEAVKRYQNKVPASYLNQDFPFLKKRKNTNELGPFFKDGKHKPNIIFILCESLARVYSGPKAKYEGVTPFLDSLVNESLYWRNFLSNCPRTYAVLPNVLGSLPHGANARGFTSISGTSYPKHTTMISYLTKQGYSSGFYYPGMGGFDWMVKFMSHQGENVACFDQRNTKMNGGEPQYDWGYSDRELFDFYIKQHKKKTEPFVDVLLSLSIHGPFDQAEPRHQKKAKYISQKYPEKPNPELLASVIYFDECMRHLITSLKKSDSFKNTILVITGDHNPQNLPLRNELDRFYVPLYISSPLLKEHKNFGGICSHLDITPSMTQLLENNFGLLFPKEVSFIGFGLDTTAQFNANRIFPLSLYRPNLANYVYKDEVFAAGRSYKINDGLNMEPIKRPKTNINQLTEDYKNLNLYSWKSDKLLRE